MTLEHHCGAKVWVEYQRYGMRGQHVFFKDRRVIETCPRCGRNLAEALAAGELQHPICEVQTF